MVRGTIGSAMPDPFAAAVTRWYRGHARDLPWRRDDTGPWGIVVSEFMLQQTPVSRVLPMWQIWMRRWPTPGALAVAAPGDAVRAWGRLGYPRRALRLHAAATAMVDRHDGAVPSSYDDLRALPGVGDYTASAVAAFAYGARTAVLDTNVRRVYRRVFDGSDETSATPTVAERAAALDRVPLRRPAEFSVAVMELGALVCTSRSPACPACPVARQCAWLAAGRPAASMPRVAQRYDGTDRQARGRLLAVLRERHEPVAGAELDLVWADPKQRARALDGLVADGLVEPLADGRFRLPAVAARTISKISGR
jgi:A/G-specific adenine glycosylase